MKPGYRLNQISPHVYWLPSDPATDRPVLGVVAGQAGSLVVDAGNSPAHARLLLAEMARLELPPPKYVALTHSHWDHVFGSSVFEQPSLASRETRRLVQEMAVLDWADEALDRRVAAGLEIEFCRDMIKAELPDRANLVLKPPDIGFTAELEVDLGDVVVHLVHVGGDHAADSSIVSVPDDRIAFLGDCLYEDIFRPEPAYTVPRLFPLIDRLLQLEADFYLWGHHEEPMPGTELMEYTMMLKATGRAVEEIGPNRELVLQTLQRGADAPLAEEQVETVDAFLAGLDKSNRR